MKSKLTHYVMSEFHEIDIHNALTLIEELCDFEQNSLKMLNKDFDYLKLNPKELTVSSIKAGNAFLNMNKLLVDVSEIGLTVSGTIATPFMIPLAALVILNKVWSNVKIDLDKKHAILIKLLWENRGVYEFYTELNVQEMISIHNKTAKSNILNSDEVKFIINDLIQLKCIDENPKGVFNLIEKIQIV